LTTPADTTNTNVHQGINIAATIGNATGGTNTANLINVANLTGDAQVSLNALKIGDLTGTAAAEYALNIGSGWDDALRVNGTQIINGTGVLQSAALSGTYSNALTLSSTSNAFTGTIGQSTPLAGSFTTLSSTGATTLGNNSSTVAIDTTSWDVSSTVGHFRFNWLQSIIGQLLDFRDWIIQYRDWSDFSKWFHYHQQNYQC
jgi:hypothetical protein